MALKPSLGDIGAVGRAPLDMDDSERATNMLKGISGMRQTSLRINEREAPAAYLPTTLV